MDNNTWILFLGIYSTDSFLEQISKVEHNDRVSLIHSHELSKPSAVWRHQNFTKKRCDWQNNIVIPSPMSPHSKETDKQTNKHNNLTQSRLVHSKFQISVKFNKGKGAPKTNSIYCKKRYLVVVLSYVTLLTLHNSLRRSHCGNWQQMPIKAAQSL